MELAEFIQGLSEQEGEIAISPLRDTLVEEYDYPVDDEIIQEMDELLENDPDAAFMNYAQLYDLLSRNHYLNAPAPNPEDVNPYAELHSQPAGDNPGESTPPPEDRQGFGQAPGASGFAPPDASGRGMKASEMNRMAKSAAPGQAQEQAPVIRQGLMSSAGDLVNATAGSLGRGIKFMNPINKEKISAMFASSKMENLANDTGRKIDQGLESINNSIAQLKSPDLSADQRSDHQANIRLQADHLQTASESIKNDIRRGAISKEEAESLKSKIGDITEKVMDSSNDDALDPETRDYIRVKTAEMMKAIQEIVNAIVHMFGRNKEQDNALSA